MHKLIIIKVIIAIRLVAASFFPQYEQYLAYTGILLEQLSHVFICLLFEYVSYDTGALQLGHCLTFKSLINVPQ